MAKKTYFKERTAREIQSLKLTQVSKQKGLVEKVLTIDEIITIPQRNNNINIEMGQTFDEGQPLEMIKYALFIMNLQDLISQKGANVSSHWIIADHFMTSINRDKNLKEIERQAKDRINYMKLLNKTYNGNIKSVLSSEISKSAEYQKN